jgi:glycosyltransferase involved in cell wall biosynthesis
MTKFKIITPAFNCEEKIETTLYSIIGQTYKDWELIVLDDVSTDNTGKKVLSIADRNNVLDKVKVKRREVKYGEVRNTHEEVNLLNENDVVIRLDAGDWLTDLGCLEFLNAIYQQYDPAVLWTAHRWAFTDRNISGDIDPNISMYEQPWRSSHLKTFRAKEFFGLDQRNFLDEEGNWIMIGCDQAVFLPMMERARRKNKRLLYFPRVMYHYDINLEDPTLFTKPRSIDQKMSAENLRARGYIE